MIAILKSDETSIEIKIKLPVTYPLKNVEVECNTKIGIPESRWKRWTLQIIQLLAQQDGAIIDAILFKYLTIPPTHILSPKGGTVDIQKKFVSIDDSEHIKEFDLFNFSSATTNFKLIMDTSKFLSYKL